MGLHDELPIPLTLGMIPEPKRKASKKRPTARTLEALRKQGATVQVVEKWQARPWQKEGGHGVRIDLFGCIDVIAIMPRGWNRPEGWEHEKLVLMGIQCGAVNGHSEHKKKCLAEPRLKLWLETGARFQIHSWGLMGARGKAKRWHCRIEELTLSDYQTTEELGLFA